MGRMDTQRKWGEDVYAANNKLKAKSELGAKTRAAMTDEQWTANMPAHIGANDHHRFYLPAHKYGFLQQNDDVNDEDEDVDEENSDNQEQELYDQGADQDDAEMDGDQDEDAQDDSEEEQETNTPAQAQPAQGLAQAIDQDLSQKKSYGKKFDGHLHETDMRVNPPLTDEGKKSISVAEKTLEEAKADYDKKKAGAQEMELKFHAAARISKASREERAKAEDRYYIQSKDSRKAARYAENMEREAQFAGARQAAADKFQEVVANANKESTAKGKVVTPPPAPVAPVAPVAPAAPAKAAAPPAPAAPAAPGAPAAAATAPAAAK